MTAAIEIDVGVAIIVLVIIFLVLGLLRRKRNIYGKLWMPLIPLVHGTALGNRLAGKYEGMPISARIAGSGNENPQFHYELTMTAGAAAGDWSLSYTGEKFLGTGAKTWRVKSKDDELARRLVEAGAVATIQSRPDQPEIAYKGKTGALHYWKPVEGMYAVPAPDEFQAQLDLLASLATMNRKVNAT